jgi:hypothetical protein
MLNIPMIVPRFTNDVAAPTAAGTHPPSTEPAQLNNPTAVERDVGEST